MENEKVTCFICGHRTLDERCDWDICPVCFWEDDVMLTPDDVDKTSPANKGMAVSEAQANFMLLGASSETRRTNVRPPQADEPLDENWKPLEKAVELFQAAKS